ncbi:hypothetical protein N0V92_013757, partial [Colletotrichum tropicale]
HISSSLLEPRIAVVLNVPKAWRPWLFACRLLSIGPHIFWALSPAVTLLVQIIPVAVPGGKKAAANLAAAGLGNAAAAAAAAGAAATGGLSYAGGGVGGGAGASYHITQRSINIKKETSTSINIFSIASFISMVSLLAHLHYNGSDYPEKPFESLARLLLELARNVVGDGIIPASFDSAARTEL